MPNVPHNQGLCPENCFGCKAASVGFSSMAMVTRRPDSIDRSKSEKIMLKDVEAYRRLRSEVGSDGTRLQPKATKGAAKLEQTAGSRFEIESGMDLHGDAKLGDKYEETNKAYLAGELMAP